MGGIGELQWRSAVLEGFAVLVAILLAFAIDAWWDLRSQQAEARAYIEAVRTELIANREALIEELEILRGWVEESELYLNTVVAPDASPSYDEVREMVWKTGPYRTTPLARAAIDDLVSSGGYKAIDLAELRRALADYARSLDNDATEQEDVRNFFNEFIYPYHVGQGSFTEFDWEEYNELPESPVSFPLDVEAFAGNRTYANLLISRILEYGNLRHAHRDLLEKIEKALALIDANF
jgi:hypothetical protein